MSTGLTPNTREEMYLSAAAGETSTSDLPTPATRKEIYLNAIANNGGGGGGGFTPTQEQLDAMNSGITSEDVEQISTNKNNISLVDVTNNFTAAEGFTKNTTLSKIYKQGNHVFGKLVLVINSGTLPTASTTLATTTEKPLIPIVTVGYCGLDAFKIGNTAYVFIAANNGAISGYDNVANNADTAINIDIDYVVS